MYTTTLSTILTTKGKIIMKTKTTILAVLTCAVLMSGCDQSTPIGELKNMSLEEMGGKEIEILSKSKDKIKSAIDACDNFKVSEDLYINAPEKAKVYEFRSFSDNDYVGREYTPQMAIEDFRNAYSYFFPDSELNEDYFSYTWTEPLENLKSYKDLPENPEVESGLVKDFSQTEGIISLRYNEGDDEEIPVNMSSTPNISSFSVCHGKIFEYTYENKLVYERMSPVAPLEQYFRVAGTYSPTSEQSFKLLDKETRICDAVRFFEEYINNAPIGKSVEKNMITKVYSVKVLEIGDIYGFYFDLQKQLKDVNFEYCPVENTVSENNMKNHNLGEGATALMIESDKADMFSSMPLHMGISSAKSVDKVISADEAVKKFSEGLTKEVEFEINDLEFVYYSSYVPTELGGLNPVTHESKVVPAWKLTAYNPNDHLTYFVYIDAKDGGNLRQYSVSKNIGVIKE